MLSQPDFKLLQSDGRVIVVGSARTELSSNSAGRLVAARFQPDGALDLGYGVLGRVDLPVPGVLGRPTAAAVDASGNLLVAGHHLHVGHRVGQCNRPLPGPSNSAAHLPYNPMARW